MIGPVRLLYNLLFPVAVLLMLPGFLVRMIRRGKYRHKFAQRFGIYSPGVREKIANTGRVWIHAVSVGEVNIALKLIQALRDADPSLAFVLSTTTSTGFKLAASRKSTWLEPIYNPLDFLPVACRAVRLIKPRALILVEAEVWPNVVCEARRLGAKAILVNARLSPRSEKRFRAARLIAAPLFNQLDALCLQEPDDIDRWTSLGVKPEKLHVTGSIKFDDSANAPRPARDFRPVLDALGIPADAPVLLGGSTFEGEEEILARVYQNIRQSRPDLFLILVPRHQERGDSVALQLERMGLALARRTRLETSSKPDVLLVDTTGELASWYQCATVVFIGKSLCERGGQNPAEPITAGVPVVFGPHMKNFASLVQSLLRTQAAIEICDEASLQNAIESLLASSETRAAMVERGVRCLEIHRGATARTVSLLRKNAFS
ncbi:MAG: 3-deoxy-D-manno-octulosonic acid transferase [bacterium]